MPGKFIHFSKDAIGECRKRCHIYGIIFTQEPHRLTHSAKGETIKRHQATKANCRCRLTKYYRIIF
jgi:hypothetical protein